MKYVLIASIVLVSNPVFTQVKFAPPSIHEEDIQNQLEELKNNFKKVNCPDKYRSILFATLPYYPELSNCRIKLVEQKRSKMMMHARPSFFSVFRRPGHRMYKILINVNAKDRIPDKDDFTYNAQIGIMAHELAHLSDYEKAGFFKLIKYGLQELGSSERKKFEQGTDALVIKKGLGWQLYDYAVQWNNLSEYYNDYKNKKKEYYLRPEIMLGILLSSGYQ